MLKTCLSKLHSLCYFMIADYIYDILSYILYTIYYTYILIYIHNIHNIHTFIYIYIYIYIYTYIYLYCPFLWVGCNSLKALQKLLVFIRSILKGWKTEMTLKPSSGFELCISLVITKYKIKVTICQTDSYMNIWPLAMNCFKMSSQSYLAGLS